MRARRPTENKPVKAKKNKPACNKCFFWEDFSSTHEGDIGDCRRYPPTQHIVDTQSGEYSINIESIVATWENDWCGEYRAR